MDFCTKGYEKCSVEALKPKGDVIKVGVVNDSLYSYVSKKNGFSSAIYLPELEAAKLLCYSMDLNCRFMLTKDSNYFSYNNGSWGGFLGDLLNGTYDMSLPTFYRTELREKYFSISNPAIYDTKYIFTRSPAVYHNDFTLAGAFLAPFKWTTWIGLCVVITAMSLFIFTLQQKKRTLSDLVTTHVNMASLLIRKGQKLPPLNVAGKTIFHVWSTSVIIITASYTSGLLASMMPLPAKPPFTDIPTLMECLNTEKCRFIVGGDSYFINTVTSDNTSNFYFLKEILDNHPPVLSKDQQASLDTIINTKDVYLVSVPLDYTEFNYTYLSNGSCLLMFMEVRASMHFILRRNNKFATTVDKQITKLNQLGLFEKITSKQSRIDRCRLQDMVGRQKKVSAKPVPFKWLINVLLLFTFGFLIAMLCLMCELAVVRLWERM